MIELAILAGLAFSLVIGIVVLHRVWRLGRVSLLDWSLLAIAGVYGAGWSLVIAVTAEGDNLFWEPWILADRDRLLIHTAGATILSAFLWLGWVVAGSLVAGNQADETTANVAIRSHGIIQRRLDICAWAMLLAAIALQLLYSHAYGGPLEILDYANSIRSGIFEVENRWSFVQPLTSLAILASFIFYGIVLSSQMRRPWLGLILSVSFSIYLLYSRLGRIGFLTYVATFALGHLLYRQRNPVQIVLRGATLLAGILIAAYYLSAALNLKFVEGLPSYLANELGFPFGSFFGHLTEGPTHYRWFIDFAVLPLYFLPSSLWTSWFEDVARINTVLILGAAKGEAGVTGAIPVDLLTLGLLQASVPGIAAVGAVFGALLRMCQVFVEWIPHIGVRAVLGAHFAMKVAVLGVFYAQPDLNVRENLYLVVGAALIIVLVARRASWSESRNHRPGW